MPPLYRGSRACSICHKKKVKCDLAETQPCTNCRSGDYTCRPHKRKRKVYSLSPSPPRGEGSTLNSSPGCYPTALPEDTTPANQGIGVPNLADQVASPAPPLPQNDTTYETPTTEQSYVGRSEYLSSQVPFTEDTAVPQKNPPRKDELSDLDLQTLSLRKAFELPPRTIRESLIDAFMERCHPWMPIVDRHWLEERDGRQPPSLLLLQAVFLAGSRVLSSPLVHTSSSEFYERAKALFFNGHEQNTTLAVVAVSLLQWWNPTGPEKFSTNTSGFWVRIGVELAYQVGLHKEPAEGRFKSFKRRLWWTLVTRDSIISVGTGRPRTVNLEDSNMKPPTLEDFPTPNTHASLFIAYVAISKHMGDIAEAQRRQSLTTSRRQRLEDALFRWIKELPRELRIAHKTGDAWATTPYNLEARQLAVSYFTSLILLHRSSSPQAPTSTVCLMASSFLVSIFEEFLSRGHISCLGPVFAFYALAAGLIQLMCFRYTSLQAIAEHEFEVIRMALEELGKRWGSAHGALRGLLRAKDAIRQQPCIEGDPPHLASNEVVFFSDFGPELCRTWDIGFGRSGAQRNEAAATDPSRRFEGWDYSTGMIPSAHASMLSQVEQPSTGPPTFGDGNEAGFYAPGAEDMNMFADPLALTEGFWLFQDFEYPGHFG